MSFYAPPPVIQCEVFASLPQKYRNPGKRKPGSAPRFGAVDSFLEGPSFDRAGNLYVVDIPFGRIFRVTPKGEFDLVVQYDGEPNGLKLHKDGRIFVADFKNGVMVLDPGTGKISPLLDRKQSASLRGVNDLVFDNRGNLYFTDQGRTSLQDPTGRVYRYSTEGALECVISNAPSPNGVALSPSEDILYVAMACAASVWRMAPRVDGNTRARILTQMTCGGADGLAVDVDGNVAIVNAQMGVIWLVNSKGKPAYAVESCGSDNITNIAYGGREGKTLFVTDSGKGDILMAGMPASGKPMYSHS
jgi:gluconolactonase